MNAFGLEVCRWCQTTVADGSEELKSVDKTHSKTNAPDHIPSDHQFGAVKGRSTAHELVNVLHICHQAADNQKITRAAFVDFAKAFDHVDHRLVLNKMAALRVQPFIIQWMHSFLLERRQRVKINIIASNWATLNGGIPQGTWLGPYIFLIHINDLQTTLLAFKFIDDVTVIEMIDIIASSQM